MEWTRESSVVHADCRVYRVLKERWRHSSRSLESDFFVLDVRDWAVVFARTNEGKFILVRQFRFGSEALSWELPAGLVEPDEDPLRAAARELKEETGFTGAGAVSLGWVHPNPALQRNRCHFIFIDEASLSGEPSPDPTEEFETCTLSLEELRSWVLSGKITHSIILSGLYLLEQSARVSP